MPWTQEQLANAATIVAAGRELGMSTRDIQIGLITAMTESNLINVDYGDRDSLGLFQQRPSQGWGKPDQLLQPGYAAAAFFIALRDLGDERYGMGMGEAAQAVQRSAYPDRYATHLGDMRKMWPVIQGTAGEAPQTIEGESYLEGLDASQMGAQGLSTTSPRVGTPQVETPDPLPPSAEQLLGAWGMSNPTIQQPEAVQVDPMLGAGPIVNPSTNASVITQLAEETGDFAKGVDGWRKAVISAARSALGTPYTWGGNSLQGGVDCSGLIQQAFARAGISIPRVSYQQANYGKRVGLDALRPGDLVAWDNSTRNNGADHIAIYLGGGQIIEAARPGTVVRIRTVDSDEGAWGVQINR